MSGGASWPRWGGAWRDDVWARLGEPHDVLIVGGGITGAGLLAEATRRGLKAALVEGGDFASGTSGQSGKLVHGGMRYIKQGRIGLTRTLLLERDRLLERRPGLVDPLDFILPTYRHHRVDRAAYGVAVRMYDLLRGRRRTWSRLAPEEVVDRVPGVRREGLDGGFRFMDAVTDDARLVLRTLREAVAGGGLALNYARVEALARERGRTVGAEVVDGETGRSVPVRARVVFNATGSGADVLRHQVGAKPRLRGIRGTHLLFPRSALPLASAVSFRHPANGRYIYALPWEGTTLVGTTDVDHPRGAVGDPRGSAGEVAYLIEALHHWLPGAGLDRGNLLGIFCGVRPVLDTGVADPYREGRGSVLLEEDGLVTVVSGKLTGFRPVVERALRGMGSRVVPPQESDGADAGTQALGGLPMEVATRLSGRYGPDAADLVAAAAPGELERVEDTPVVWAELRWALRAEGVVHLDDLLLRRARVGLTLPHGGAGILPRVRELCVQELGWGDARWVTEKERYEALWRDAHGVP